MPLVRNLLAPALITQVYNSSIICSQHLRGEIEQPLKTFET